MQQSDPERGGDPEVRRGAFCGVQDHREASGAGGGGNRGSAEVGVRGGDCGAPRAGQDGVRDEICGIV